MNQHQTEESIELTRTLGPLQAEIIAGRLRAAGIPAWVWQEGAGAAQGLIVGTLGTGHVMVPASYAGQARELLAEKEGEAARPEEGGEGTYGHMPVFSKAILLALAFAVSGAGTVAALALGLLDQLLGRAQPSIVQCPYCGNDVELDEAERARGAYVCPFCNTDVNADAEG